MTEKYYLHIETTKLLRLKMDGPALSVLMHGAAERLFPLRRLAHIHISGKLDQGMDALLICANRHIPVAFFDRQGHLRALLYLPLESTTVLGHWLENRHTDAGIEQIYQQWLENIQLHWLAEVRKLVELITHEHKFNDNRQNYDAVVAQRLKVIGLHKMWIRAQPWLEGILRVHIGQCIDRIGLSPHTHEHRELLCDMEKPISQLLRFQLALWLIQDRPKEVSGPELSNIYEAIAEQVQHEAEKSLYTLQYAIERVV